MVLIVWAPVRKLFTAPGVPHWLRVYSLPRSTLENLSVVLSSSLPGLALLKSSHFWQFFLLCGWKQDTTTKIIFNQNFFKNAVQLLCLHTRDDRIVDFYYPILSCFWKMISVSDPNPVLVKIILSVSENYPKVYYDAQYTFLRSVYFALWGKITAEVILPLAEPDWLKLSHDKCGTHVLLSWPWHL